MVENTGSLDLDDEGHLDFYGHSSGRAFLLKMRTQFGQVVGSTNTSSYAMPHPSRTRSGDSPSMSGSVAGIVTPNTYGLPLQPCARVLCESALDSACAVLSFVHQPTFYAMFDRVYNQQPQALDGDTLKFIPLLYAVIAVGALFSTAENSQLMTSGLKNAIDQGQVNSPFYSKIFPF